MAKNKRPASSLDRATPHGVGVVPEFSPVEPIGLNHRATTFPVSRSIYDSNNQFRTNTMSNPNLRQDFQDIASPTDLTFTGSPTSGITDPNVQQPDFSIPQAFGTNNGLPDLSAMMFPSGDPFAYPNQPMTEFDNIKQENDTVEQSPSAPTFLPNSTTPGSGLYDDLEGQLFGPIPPYLMQGQQFFDAPGQLDVDSSILSSLNPQPMSYNYTSIVDGNFDSILGGGENDWRSSVMDQ